ncbi:hypothetical protein HPP92_021967 [Vanilla planifolia]|uniref:Uncharacterized protein n=1 Tax=Vanilla planifolia TaxID=51239 RepID=A0A835PSH7_VANPL|nr:hypothetical protein HPP92_021967 [Vanilla planifolia]
MSPFLILISKEDIEWVSLLFIISGTSSLRHILARSFFSKQRISQIRRYRSPTVESNTFFPPTAKKPILTERANAARGPLPENHLHFYNDAIRMYVKDGLPIPPQESFAPGAQFGRRRCQCQSWRKHVDEQQVLEEGKKAMTGKTGSFSRFKKRVRLEKKGTTHMERQPALYMDLPGNH